jgi:transcription elongation factor SPT6
MIESHLGAEREANSSRIAYCFTLSRERPGNATISYQPSGKCYHEMIEVLPTGFKFRGREFNSIERLVEWFKRNYKST